MTTSNNLKIYLIAGEPSGDLLGSRLMRALRQKTNGKVEFFGLGGDTMEAEGLSRCLIFRTWPLWGLLR